MAWSEQIGREFGTSVGVHVYDDGCLVEGHRGLLTCTPQSVRVRRRRGSVTIEGQALVVRTVTRDEVWVGGRIEAVHWNA